ncbi:hypothetical protein ETB97_001396 [Aspergillus alliaceus]|uniref:Uncharacterized protein n=1 Tax=Petromyces alliaceus TaxID=209559 RepID=A0A8H6E6R0_PETAA|nr:hypothetical protein ETB97_001396 [Aspergillus burnettii]
MTSDYPFVPQPPGDTDKYSSRPVHLQSEEITTKTDTSADRTELLAQQTDISQQSETYRVSPNAILAVVVAVVRAALVFPVSSCLGQIKWNQYRERRRLLNLNALGWTSCGVWGSVQMIFSTRPSVASFVAITVVLSVVIDPLAQQFLVFPSRVVPASNETASVQAA